MLVITKLLLGQKYKTFCHDKHTFVTTKDGFSRNKHVCCNKNMFVATKIILVAAPANDNDHVAVKYVETGAGVNHLAFGHSHPVTYPMIMLLSNMWGQVLVSVKRHLDTPTQSHTQ